MRKIFLPLVVFCSFTLFTSCNKDEGSIVNDEQQVVQTNSEIIIYKDVFNELMAQIGSTKTRGEISDNDVWNIISSSFYILKDGKEVNIQDYFKMLNMSEGEAKELILGKIFLFENPYIPQTRAHKPTLEEIRNAMLEECENGYVEPITTACEWAVKLAYYYKKMTSKQ